MTNKAKKAKRAGNGGSNRFGALIMLLPAALAAVTAFLNTRAARDNGAIDTLIGKGKKSKGDKRSDQATAA